MRNFENIRVLLVTRNNPPKCLFVSKGAAAGFKHGSATDVPPSVDWGEEGIVTRIKDQENVVKITWY